MVATSKEQGLYMYATSCHGVQMLASKMAYSP